MGPRPKGRGEFQWGRDPKAAETSVIIDDFNVRRAILCPNEANPKLIIDPNGVLPSSIAS